MINNESNPKTLVGKVVGDKMAKTIVVLVERTVKHLKYQKTLKKKAKFHVHDENEIAVVGQNVRIRESKPISKTKSWLLLDVIS